HQAKNEWLKETQRPQAAIDLADHIRREVEKNGMYLSSVDLENDMANSNLFNTLKDFYNTRTVASTVNKMQTAKAENMLQFLKQHYTDLTCLADDKISEPLKRIQKLAEKVIKGNVSND